MASGCGGARLLRQPKLLLQFFHQLLEALCGDGVVAQGSCPLGLFQPPLQFFSVALFSHGGDTLLSIKTEERRNSSQFQCVIFA
jgi:hypothetical protein